MGNKNLRSYQYWKIKNREMKNIKFIYLKITLLLGFIFTIAVGCEREVSDEVTFATYPDIAEVFIDGFSGGLEYRPFANSYFEAFSVDTETTYDGSSASMRFDVPNVGDPKGTYAGAIFPDAGGRDLSGYDALTFWAKGTIPGTINEIGFGNDFGENKFMVTMQNVKLTTNWRKYIIPIPDPTKLTFEKGMFWYAEGPENGNGYTFWIDELKYEKLGTIAQPHPAIFGGVDKVQQTFNGSNIAIDGTQTFNLESGLNQTVLVAPSYFTFSSTNVDVARVSELGIVTVVGAGTAKITAVLGGVKAAGSLTIVSAGAFVFAPNPDKNPANVISVFSDAYNNISVDFYNGFFEPYQTTLGGNNININGNEIISYTELNFVGIQFSQPTVNATQMTHLHLDILVQEPKPIGAGNVIKIQLQNYGADGTVGNGDDSSHTITFTASNFVNDTWVSLDIPLANFTGLNSRANLGLLLFDTTVNNLGTISAILVDNIYFYK